MARLGFHILLITIVSVAYAQKDPGSPTGAFVSKSTLSIKPGEKGSPSCSPGSVIAVKTAKFAALESKLENACTAEQDMTDKVQATCDWQLSCVLAVKAKGKMLGCNWVPRALDVDYSCLKGITKPAPPTRAPPNSRHRGIVPVELLD
ncbi:hypothetical protein BV898_06007 [Hypsibius exemplaris]|uniref:SUEL-type lectin domain-containing protein n=1 Tax=Hypsibius exemplaris TaxID=2072580 RepID=A0A1W0WXV4_HYPEX|nr:hypothetical protein BV898_06007 [Hypsibius exemplaris]